MRIRQLSALRALPQPMKYHPARLSMSGLRMLTNEATASRPTTYSNQDRLPRLPVPSLEKSLEAYVKSLVPLLEQKVRDPRSVQHALSVVAAMVDDLQYTGSTLQKEIEKRKIFARDFATQGGLGRALQERLKGQPDDSICTSKGEAGAEQQTSITCLPTTGWTTRYGSTWHITPGAHPCWSIRTGGCSSKPIRTIAHPRHSALRASMSIRMDTPRRMSRKVVRAVEKNG